MTPRLARRTLLLAFASAPFGRSGGAAVVFPRVVPATLAFPRDHGAHPEFRVEWWYLTAVLEGVDGGTALGIQVTFFRVRTQIDAANPSRFAAHQLLFGHAALADAGRASLLVDQQIARLGSGAVRVATHDTDIALNRWRFARRDDGRFECEVAARGFRLRFVATPSQPVLLQGGHGFFPKETQGAYASYYYSVPQLRLEAEILRDDRKLVTRGIGWLDHEWASTLLEPAATGWDWIGMNLDDGAALTAFQTRRKGDDAVLFAYASMRAAGEVQPRLFAQDQVRFEPLAHWESPRTRARYPVAQRIAVGGRVFETRPLFADQELDARPTGSAIYWEGASTLSENGTRVGRGYLELTGYAGPLTL
ncbi:MAG TPA: lipocalin-like domain-containing protein [Burkholderiaceae bacterium]|nr:lipocalin-like domain-containing protein [Burkholderiaceae bacterium]